MAAPNQQKMAQPPQYTLEQPQQQPVQMIQQPQYVPQTQVLRPRKVRKGCCVPDGKSLPLSFRPTQSGFGFSMVFLGFASVVFGIVGIFTARGVYHGYQYVSYYPNPTAWIGANIWAGVFVSFGSTVEHFIING